MMTRKLTVLISCIASVYLIPIGCNAKGGPSVTAAQCEVGYSTALTACELAWADPNADGRIQCERIAAAAKLACDVATLFGTSAPAEGSRSAGSMPSDAELQTRLATAQQQLLSGQLDAAEAFGYVISGSR